MNRGVVMNIGEFERIIIVEPLSLPEPLQQPSPTIPTPLPDQKKVHEVPA